MGGTFTVDFATQSKVLLTTASEHGFADNTNFYFVNTVSPKILDVVDPTAVAPDGNDFVDTLQSTSVNVQMIQLEQIHIITRQLSPNVLTPVT